MNEIQVHNLDETVIRQLRQIAWEDGVSLEESVRRLLSQATQNRQAGRLDKAFPLPTD